MIKRKRTADFLKGLAVILMIQVHLMELFAQQEIYNSFWGKISLFLGGPPAAPIFMAVMGYFLAFSQKGLLSDIKRGFKLIIWGFALNIGLNLNLFYHIFIGKFQLSPFEYLFGVDILFLAGLSVIIIGLIKHFFKQNIWAYVMALFFVILIPTFLNPPIVEGNANFVLSYFFSDVWWSYFPILPWLAYVLVGYIFNLLESKIIPLFNKYKWYFLTASVIILFFTINYGFQIASNLHEYYQHGITFFVFTLVFMVFLLIITNLITQNFNNLFTRYVEWLGLKVTSTYVFQWLIIGNISTLIFKTQNWWQLTLWFCTILLVVSTLVFSWQKIKEREKSSIV